MKADWDKNPQGTTWTGFVHNAIKISNLTKAEPADGATFWTGYAGADEASREQFWLMLISAVAKMESNFDPNCVYNEGPPLNQKSLGLMQLSTTDTSYGCDFPSEDAVMDPRRNLACAVRILDRLVNKDGRIGGDQEHFRKGGAAYWSTLRVPKPKKRDARGYVIERTSAL